MPKLIIAFFFILCADLNAQTYLTTYEYQKIKQSSAAIDLPYAENITEEALKEFMLKKGAGKPVTSKGILIFRNTRLNDSVTVDLYCAVERKSRKEKDFCTVFFMPVRVNESPALRSPGEKFGLPSAQVWLDELAPGVVAHALELDIKNQQDILAKVNKKYNSLVSDHEELQKRKTYIEEKIELNTKDQEKQRAEVENQRQLLEALIVKRKPQ